MLNGEARTTSDRVRAVLLISSAGATASISPDYIVISKSQSPNWAMEQRMSNRQPRLCFPLLTLLAIAGQCSTAQCQEPDLRRLPPGLVVEKAIEVNAAQVEAIGKKLGGKITRLSNIFLRVSSRPIQVNFITAADAPNATAIFKSIAKPYPFCIQKGALVVEYVSKEADAAVATKTSYELGILPKPSRVRYRVTAELATVDKADYMACNPLLVELLALEQSGDQTKLQNIKDLAAKFRFGRDLVLRNTKLDSATYNFQPAAINSRESPASISFSFDKLPLWQSIPYVTANLDITVDDSAFLASAEPPRTLTAATKLWPADDPDLD